MIYTFSMSILIGLFTLALVVVSILLVLLVLAQKSKSDGGVGGALGGGMTEATFGADSGNVLSRMTHYGAIAFFLLSFGLYLAQINRHTAVRNKSSLPTLDKPVAAAPATTAPVKTEAVATPATKPVSEAPAPSVTLPATSSNATQPAANP
ncbi:MAG: preprotein translocase subunit SecG [Verrucomicrobiota bacterium]